MMVMKGNVMKKRGMKKKPMKLQQRNPLKRISLKMPLKQLLMRLIWTKLKLLMNLRFLLAVKAMKRKTREQL